LYQTAAQRPAEKQRQKLASEKLAQEQQSASETKKELILQLFAEIFYAPFLPF
jgi:hypothetical protein